MRRVTASASECAEEGGQRKDGYIDNEGDYEGDYSPADDFEQEGRAICSFLLKARFLIFGRSTRQLTKDSTYIEITLVLHVTFS